MNKINNAGIYKTKVEYVDAFRVGYDYIPNWFIDMILHCNLPSCINEKGFIMDNKLMVPSGDYIVKQGHDGYIALSELQFKEKYEIQEYISKFECESSVYCLIRS